MIIKCAALDCLHNSNGKCAVTDETQIDVDSNGCCLDYSPLTEEELKEIKSC
ncbi:MAG: hypothetical protein RBT49_08515 [Bacteroidales bacterium]|jgi:hypothetical protein|nr:hypothetical protein [Bacteroidales bacterium]